MKQSGTKILSAENINLVFKQSDQDRQIPYTGLTI